MTVHDSPWQLMTVHDTLCQSMTVLDSPLQSMTVLDSPWQSLIAIFKRSWLEAIFGFFNRESRSYRVKETESQGVRESRSQRVKESESQGVREPGSQYCINFVLVYRAHIHSLCNLFFTFFVTFFIDEHINFHSATSYYSAPWILEILKCKECYSH